MWVVEVRAGSCVGCWFALLLLLPHPDEWGALRGSRYVGLLCGVFVWYVSRTLRFMGVGLCGLVLWCFRTSSVSLSMCQVLAVTNGGSFHGCVQGYSGGICT